MHERVRSSRHPGSPLEPVAQRPIVERPRRRIAFRATCNDEPMDRLAGRVAVVTGAGGGIGSEVALVFAEHGAIVVANDVDPHTLGQTALACQRHTRESIAIVADVSESAAVDDMFAQVRERFGRVDALVTVAGISSLADRERERLLERETGRGEAAKPAASDAPPTYAVGI